MVRRAIVLLQQNRHGYVLVVDAAQGVEAQTVANVHLAMKQNLTIIPVINKVDLPNADVPTVKKQLEDILTISAEEAILASAKTGLGVLDVLEAIVHRVPAPKPFTDGKLRALVIEHDFGAVLIDHRGEGAGFLKEDAIELILEGARDRLGDGDAENRQVKRATAVNGREVRTLEPSADASQRALAQVRAAGRRDAQDVSVGADEPFARSLGGFVLTLDPATGRLKARGGWLGAFRRR